MREVGKGVYGLGYAHSVRFDKYDNLWVVDKGTHSVMRFNPAGYVTLNLGRRPEGPDEPEWFKGNGLGRGESRPAPPHVDSYFRAPTDIAFDSDDNLYVSDGYVNSRVAKFDKHRQLGQVVGNARTRRHPRRPRIPDSSTRRTTSASIARTTSTSPIATTAASRCSTATARSSASSS